jgi:predicted DsbA family dithiol-disulfide isomerase
MTIIEVFADIGCPFTHVGLHRFVERRAELDRPDVVLRVRSWPLEIVNGAPLDPDFIAEEVDEIREQAAADLFAGFQRDAFPATTVPAMELAAVAYRVSDELGEQVSIELRDLLFEQGVDVGDPATLARVAEQHQLDVPSDVHQVERDHAEGVRRGVIGSPHFFTPGGDFFCPSLDVGRDASGHLRVTADPAGFAAFLDDCLRPT